MLALGVVHRPEPVLALGAVLALGVVHQPEPGHGLQAGIVVGAGNESEPGDEQQLEPGVGAEIAYTSEVVALEPLAEAVAGIADRLVVDMKHIADIAADKGHIQDTVGNIVGIVVAAAGTIARE